MNKEGKTVNVKFTANKPGAPGTWVYCTKVSIPIHGSSPSIVRFQLDRSSTRGWCFERIAICENAPAKTDWMEVGKASKHEIDFDGLVVKAKFSTGRKSITVSLHRPNETLDKPYMKIGVLLAVSNGREWHMSRDPQIILERDPTGDDPCPVT